ncbi:MAG: hypothetical protein KDB23_30465, partial [Planctomycetales bacterium]|nr:hypothetical protein [Planctomycetales bacterium]
MLTQFSGGELRLTKHDVPDVGLAYIVSVPEQPTSNHSDAEVSSEEETEDKAQPQDYTATFEYLLEAVRTVEGIPVLTGLAAVQQLDVRYDRAGWEVTSGNAVRIEPLDAPADVTRASVLLGLGETHIQFKPRSRDVTTEQTQFFVEASNLYVPGPGVVDGRHRLHVRVSQGQVTELKIQVPSDLTVSAVDGPVGSWQFDADTGKLTLEVEPAQAQNFDVQVSTQRGLDVLPTELTLAPLQVEGASGQVGLVAIGFGPDAQPEKIATSTMSAVGVGDFDQSLVPSNGTTVHRVYRYGVEGGSIELRVAPVAPEVRVISKQVLSFGDERVVLAVNFAAEITRAGLFQLSFNLPAGIDVESLSGPALHHWSELNENNQRQIILHLNGKTIGVQEFSLTLAGPTPNNVDAWHVPRFQLNEANRQSGDLIVRPTTGIRLRTLNRQNVSEADPRSLGGEGQGALAFQLLQRDWALELGIEKLEPWVTGQLLHEVSLREGQTRTVLMADFLVQHASIRSLQVVLPIADPEEIRTLRITGNAVSDFVRTAPTSNIWEIQFKRRIVGSVDFRVEYERRGER